MVKCGGETQVRIMSGKTYEQDWTEGDGVQVWKESRLGRSPVGKLGTTNTTPQNAQNPQIHKTKIYNTEWTVPWLLLVHKLN